MYIAVVIKKAAIMPTYLRVDRPDSILGMGKRVAVARNSRFELTAPSETRKEPKSRLHKSFDQFKASQFRAPSLHCMCSCQGACKTNSTPGITKGFSAGSDILCLYWSPHLSRHGSSDHIVVYAATIKSYLVDV